MRNLVFVFLLLPVLTNAQLQDSTQLLKRRYKATSYSIPWRYTRDMGNTPLIHRGPGIQIGYYTERFRKKAITKPEIILGVGLISTNGNKVDLRTQGSYLYLELNYHYMRPVTKLFKERAALYAGAILTNTMDNRYYSFLPNNAYGYEYSNVINPAAHITYDFNFGKSQRRYQLGFKMNFALLAHVIRPNFIGMEPAVLYMEEEINPLAMFTHNNKLALPNRFFRINTELYLDRFKLNSSNKFRFYYGWGVHITDVPDSNPLYTAYHSIGFVNMIYSEKYRKSKKNKKALE